MKIAPFIHALEKRADEYESFLVHTGQHYDAAMSQSFFDALSIPRPDVDLGIGSGSHAEQVGNTMIEFEKVVKKWHPDWIVVVGDVNATCACSITARKEHIKLAHIEAGLRSFDEDMPEEINRLVTDRLSDILFTPDKIANQNLHNEGVPDEKIKFVGNIMIDTLEAHREEAMLLDPLKIIGTAKLDGQNPLPDVLDNFAVMTLHRPSNVDEQDILTRLVRYFIDELADMMPLVWTIHPRTKKQLQLFGLWDEVMACPGIIMVNPLGYLEMLRLNFGARVMLTDSGGLQEECCVAGTPCVTMRENTERPVTLREHGGLSELAGNNVDKIRAAVNDMFNIPRKAFRPELWDGNTAERIVDVLSGG
jgi:UDP-N-acetylglucosamine 2-epimerase (non-hydrolysing)